jgi:hypothetical protein
MDDCQLVHDWVAAVAVVAPGGDGDAVTAG